MHMFQCTSFVVVLLSLFGCAQPERYVAINELPEHGARWSESSGDGLVAVRQPPQFLAEEAVTGASEVSIVGIGASVDRQAVMLQRRLAQTAGFHLWRDGYAIQLSVDSGAIFKVGSSDVSLAGAMVFDQLAATMLEFNTTTANMSVHTDATGSERSNQRLSENQAAAIVAALMQRGVPRERLSSAGFGQQKPVASNSSAVGRDRNRRVEVTLAPR